MTSIPFLRPKLVSEPSYRHLIEQIDASGWYTNYGPMNTSFEDRALVELIGRPGAVSTCSNATLGLMLALSMAKGGTRRYAIMPSFTFAATAQAALWAGLEPFFVDVDPELWTVQSDEVLAAIDKLGSENCVAVPYATFGSPLDLRPYAALESAGVPVVVDAAASLGSDLPGHSPWDTIKGPIVFSMHATKAFPIGEGCLVYSSNPHWIKEFRRAANFGFNDARSATMLGLNAKLPEVTAAIAIATLDALPGLIRDRRNVRDTYVGTMREHGLFESGWKLQRELGESAPQFMSLLAPPERDNTKIVASLNAVGVQAQKYFSPSCHQQPLFRDFATASLTATCDLSARIVSCPLWPDMTAEQVHHVVAALPR
jgi:dTDP-4-amino-4,6-dideoxygalactose transaminase